jgi:rhamnosyltransferase subunit B
MMIVFFAMGTLGDVIPYIKIARRLQSKKRRVLFLSNEIFREVITGNGFFFYPVADRETFNRVFSNPKTWSPEGVDQHVIDYHLPAYRPAYEFMRDLVGSGEKVLAVYQGGMNGVKMACMEFCIPSVQVALAPSAFHSSLDPCFPMRAQVAEKDRQKVMPIIKHKMKEKKFEMFVGPFVNPVRRELGLDDWSAQEMEKMESEAHRVALFPDWFRPVPADWPKELKCVGFPLDDTEVRRTEAMDVFSAFCKRHGEPIVFAPGTAFGQSDRYVQWAQQVCAAMGKPGVFVGPHVSPAVKYGGRNFTCLDYLQFVSAFKRACLVVHHGGIGTIVAALQAGVPQMTRPLTFDQPDNSYWLYRLGIANAFDSGNYCAEAFAELATELLGKPDLSRDTEKYRKMTLKQDGAKSAAKYIEDLVAGMQ